MSEILSKGITMEITLKPEHKQMLESLVQQGYYHSQEEAIERALHLLAQDISQVTESGLYAIDEKEPNEQILADLATSIQEAKAGLTFPVSQLWDDLEED